jgi:hypothetical protein
MLLMKRLVVPESAYGVCVWEFPDGTCFGNDDGLLSMEGLIGDKRVEAKMQRAAEYWLGDNDGKPKWVSGARKVSRSEWEDQNERFLDGKIPDPVDQVRQLMQKGK